MLLRAAALLAVIAVVANAAPIEVPVSPLAYGAPPIQTHPVAIASDGNDFEILWTEGFGTYASLVDPTGQPLKQIRLTSGPLDGVQMCWSGTAYVLVWSANNVLNVATLNGTGDIVRAPFATSIASSAFPLSMATNGTAILVAFEDSLMTSVDAAVLSREGEIIKSGITFQAVPVGETLDRNVKAATNGDAFAIFWTTEKQVGPVGPGPQVNVVSTLDVARVSSSGDGTLLPPVGTFGYIPEFDVAYGSGRYVVVVDDMQFGSPALRRFLVDPATVAVTELAPSRDTAYGAHLAVLGGQLAAYGTSPATNGFFVAAFSADGGALPLDFHHVSDVRNAPYAASNGHSLLVTWTDSETKAQAIDRNLAAGPVRAVAMAPREQDHPVMAAGSGQSLVVWFEQTSAAPYLGEIHAARITSSGAILDRQSIVVATNATQSAAAVVAAAGGYFVAWDAGGGIQGRRVERDGSLGAILAYAAPAAFNPALAASTNTILLVFRSFAPNAIEALRLAQNGAAIDATPLFVSNQTSVPQVASNGSDFLVVWEQGSVALQFPSPNLRDVFGARVSATGAVDATSIAIANGPLDEGEPNVASDGRDYVVVYGVGSPTATIETKRVLREGQLADTTADVPGTSIGQMTVASPAAIASAGTGFFVAWGVDSLAYARHLDGRGNPDTDPVVVASMTPLAQPAPLLSPAIAPSIGQSFVAAYDRAIDDGRSPVVSRVFLNVPAPGPRRRTVK